MRGIEKEENRSHDVWVATNSEREISSKIVGVHVKGRKSYMLTKTYCSSTQSNLELSAFFLRSLVGISTLFMCSSNLNFDYKMLPNMAKNRFIFTFKKMFLTKGVHTVVHPSCNSMAAFSYQLSLVNCKHYVRRYWWLFYLLLRWQWEKSGGWHFENVNVHCTYNTSALSCCAHSSNQSDNEFSLDIEAIAKHS